ncbi:uncharacterized protein LOC115887681 [Sitophilus oryzae]|uniref:Uncharacterized protein LOC115887681 n=1 Tax=Sitophilus oryzae TaxID=7048 RepID=A0A6J2YI99_SITOR|nr:uncharacterized protein LOC115887681 [Sitophilus oryzae]
MNNLAIADRPLKITEALEKMEQKSVEKVTTPRERRHSHGSFYENVSSSETATKPSNLKPTQSSSVQSKTLPKEKPEKHNPIIANAAESTIVKEKRKYSDLIVILSHTGCLKKLVPSLVERFLT